MSTTSVSSCCPTAYYAAALIRCPDGPSVTGDDRTTR
ncbi:hypothetical protein T12_13308 [Trichinella patagoniensis]|uniref:Uncharacterized protein n=1 Tax=Trichinella patagoniensis TaxID=990121 RepID=A0A0V0Z3Z2_9BILA|nr:hypothetical protein T12_13308 [Trichinella patagoniensis]